VSKASLTSWEGKRREGRMLARASFVLLRVRVLFLIFAAVCLISACGSQRNDETSPAQRATDGATDRFRSWRIVETTVMQDPHPAKTVDRGVMDVARDRSHIIIDLGPAGDDAPTEHVHNGRMIGEEIRIGDVVYQGRALVEPSSGKPWVKLDYERAFGDDGLGGSESDATAPDQELRALRVVSADFGVVGREQLNGVETTHYRGSMNVGAVEGTWDLWVGGGLIRKMRFADPEGTFVTTTEFFDFGVRQRIEAPPPELVADGTETLRPSPGKCHATGDPITIEEAEEVLRKHGFSVHSAPGSADCGGRGEDEHRLIDLTNILFEGPHENIASHREVTEREGHLICTVRPRPIYGGGPRIVDDTERGEEASLTLANLECGLYPEDARARAPHELRLRAAFLELQRHVSS
jgi:hypothetical protein